MATGCKSRAPKGPTTTHSPPVARRGLPIPPNSCLSRQSAARPRRGHALSLSAARFRLRGAAQFAALAAQRTRLQRVDDYLRTPPIRRVKIFEKIDTSQCSTTCRTALLHFEADGSVPAIGTSVKWTLGAGSILAPRSRLRPNQDGLPRRSRERRPASSTRRFPIAFLPRIPE
jgi:hypothetical protein